MDTNCQNVVNYHNNDNKYETDITNDLDSLNTENKQELTAIQRAQKKYMKKYMQDPENRQKINKNKSNYYYKNREHILEKRKKKLAENPELLEKERERLRESQRKIRERKKIENKKK